MRYRLVFTIGMALVGSGDNRAAAQQPGAPRAGTPAYSPYLNLLRQGNSPATNYYGLVRPQVQARDSLLSLQSQVGANGQAISDLATGGQVPSTGKAVGFLNYGGYFQNLNPGSGGVGGAGGGAGFGTGGGAGFGTLGGGRGTGGTAGGRMPAAPRR